MKDDGTQRSGGETLQRRARELAQPVQRRETSEQTLQLLIFRMLGAQYALPLADVEEVARIEEVYPIPCVPGHMSGIFRRHGRSIALVNLRVLFTAEAEGIADSDYAVVVFVRGKRFAIQVEDIEGVVRVVRSSLVPPPDSLPSVQLPFISGVSLNGLAVLDVGRLLDSEGFRGAAVQSALGGAEAVR